MSWPEVAAGLAAARSYWLSTTMPSGAPHVAPVWGVVISDVLYLYRERLTRKAAILPPTRAWWCTWKAPTMW